MTRFPHRLIAFAFGLALSLYAAEAAEAAFLPVNLDAGAARIDVFESAGEAVPLTDLPQEDSSLSKLLLEFGLLAVPLDSSGGMGSTGSGPSSVPPFVLADTHECSSGQVVAYLVDQPQLRVPIPFLDGVFRPPRA